MLGQMFKDKQVIASDLQDWLTSQVNKKSIWRRCKLLNFYLLLQNGLEKEA